VRLVSDQSRQREYVREIASKRDDFPQWYTDVILKSEMMDYTPVRGCMVIRPYGYAVWERIQALLDVRLKATGHQNAYFPLFIPEGFLRREIEHFEGFNPEVAWVTHGGGEQLAERLAVRPTSETVICTMYAKWIQSYRDLPVLLNQWCNVVRWERSTRPFLRTTEFLWQEGHTVHRTEEEAEEETLLILDIYKDLIERELAIPIITGRKSEAEKFAGALRTYALEALMTDGQALQAGTSHNLGQHFAKVFEIKFLDADGQLKYPWQTSWAVTTRLLGGLVMVHGDERGLVMPPNVAPVQVVIVPIMPRETRDRVLAAASDIARSLGPDVRVRVDDREEQSPGWKFNEWELRGVPLRLEVGPRDIERDRVVVVRRLDGAKTEVPRGAVSRLVPEMLARLQQEMYAKALVYRDSRTKDVADLSELEDFLAAGGGFARVGWCGGDSCEAEVKQRTGATIRTLANEDPGSRRCLCCAAPAKQVAYMARAY